MPGQRLFDDMRCLGMLGRSVSSFKIILEHGLEVRMCALFNDFLGALLRGKTAKICQPLLGDDDIHIVLGMVHMGNHRYNGGNETILGCGGRKEG